MSRRARTIRRALPTVLTALGAVAAIVAVLLALPNGESTANTAQPRTTASVESQPRTPTSTADSPGGAVAVPALPRSTSVESAEKTSPEQTDAHSARTAFSSTAAQADTTAPGPDDYVTAESTSPVSTPRITSDRVVTKSLPVQPKPPATTAQSPATTAKRPTSTAKPHASTTKSSSSATKPAATNFGIPVTLGNATQLVTVTAKSRSATVGALRAWQKDADGTWRTVYGPVTANLGSEGIGPASEYHSRTPLGTFTLTQAFGRLANPGTALPYHVTGPNDWWVSDVNAPSYNTMQTCAKASCPFNTRLAEHLQYITPYYDYAVVMDVNRNPVVKGGGSAFFLHVSVGKPTAGCVAIDKSTLVKIMKWLKPAGHPRIATGIG